MDPEVEEGITKYILNKTPLTRTEVTLIITMFKYHDTDADGHLSLHEATKLYMELGYGTSVWENKRTGLEAFLLTCGREKRDVMSDNDEVVSDATQAFRIMDNPTSVSGNVNLHKLTQFLKLVDLYVDGEVVKGGDLDEDTIERIAETISPTGEHEFNEDDLYLYIAENRGRGGGEGDFEMEELIRERAGIRAENLVVAAKKKKKKAK